MVITVSLVLAVIAVLASVVAAAGRCPLWIPVFVLAVFALLQSVPAR